MTAEAKQISARRRIRDDRARAKVLLGTIVVIPNPPGSRVRNLGLVPYEPGSCTTEDAEGHREMQERKAKYMV